MDPETTDLLNAGLAALAGGCSLIPIDGRTKKPMLDLLPQVCDVPRRHNADGQLLSSRGAALAEDAIDIGRGAWGDYTRIRPSAADVRSWVRQGAQLAIVAGEVSGNVECLDFDVVESIGACLYGAWRDAVEAAADDLPLQRTGGGGFQVVYRAPEIAGNQKLAFVLDPSNEKTGESIAIETRGEGGYFVIAPSSHPSGRRYAMLRGDWGAIPTLEQQHREHLIDAARALDESEHALRQKAARAPAKRTAYPAAAAGQDRVIDAWCAAHEVERVLEDAGYVWAGRRLYLPGNGDPLRAGVVLLADRSYHHDSEDPLSDGYSHSAFDVWCHFQHEGNVEAAVHAAAVELNLPYAPHGDPVFDDAGFACCPTHGMRLRTGKTSGYYCPSADPAGPRGWCGYYWRAGSTYTPPAEGSAPPATPGDTDDATPLPPGRFHRTDLGNARRLVAAYGERVRYVHAWDRWLVWDAARWAMDETGSVQRLARETIASIYGELPAIADRDARKDLAKWALASESRQRLTAMVALAQAEEPIPIRHEALNADPYLLGCPNGTLDLRTGVLRPADPADLITKQVSVPYDPQATCVVWDRFLARIFDQDHDLYSFVKRAIGMTLTADVREQVLFFLYGTGRNGKSTFIEVLLDLLGDYALKAPTEMLMAKPTGGGIPNDVAQLPGARLVVTAETEEGRRLNESMVKDLTGGDRITARFMRGEFFSFKPTHTIWMYGNHKPVIRGTDMGIWRRMRLIPFSVTIPDDEVDPELPARLRQPAELAGILRWMVEGCMEWQASGLGAPPVVTAATEEYRQEMDVLGAFITDCCVVHPTARVGATELYGAYKAWAERNGERERSQTAFGRYLKDRGFPDGTNPTGRKDRVGIGLKVVEDRQAPALIGHPTYDTGETNPPPDSSPDSSDGSDSSRIPLHANKALAGDIGELSELSEQSERESPAITTNGTNGQLTTAPDLSLGLWSDYDRRMVDSALKAHRVGRADKAREWRGKVRSKVARDWLDEQLATVEVLHG